VSTDDAALLQAAQGGDRQALGTLLERYAPAITRFSVKMCRNPEDAQDVLQETLAAAARGLGDFRGDASLSTWLFTVARSFCIKKRRTSKHAPERIVPLEDAQGTVAAPAGTAPDEVAASRQAVEALEQALAALDPDQREVLLLRDVEGLAAKEAAAIVGISVGALKSRLHRARAELRTRMLPWLEPEAPPATQPSCPEIASVFSRYLEDDITPSECERMEAHVQGCASCRAACDSLRASLSLCRASAAEVPPDIQERVRRAIDELLATAQPDLARP
jgi:RNA polymerase sigma-70 factor (ECF subfamily)